ncbi:MAG: CNNM domain-containing protein [Candidatus Aenigmatarchaeota archaeon]
MFIVLQGFFSAFEISVVSSDILKLRYYTEKGDKKLGKVYEFFLKPERFLATTLIGINISLVISSSFFTFFLIHLGIKRSNLFTMFIFTPLIVIFGELVPKNIGIYFKEEFSGRFIDLFMFFEKIFSPLVRSIEITSKFLISNFIGKVKRRSIFVTKEEINYLLKEIEREGRINKGEKKAIEEILEFTRRSVNEVYVKKEKVVMLDYWQSYFEILEVIKKNIFTRYPVLKENEIVGYINIYDLFYNSNNLNWKEFIRPMIEIEINCKLYEAFIILKTKKENIALVKDKDKICGIITLQDLTKEIINSLVIFS